MFSDGSFVFIPKGVRCPMELSTYFRINARNTGQFERTLIIAEEGASVSYLEGCTAPMRDENQLHAAVVELVALDDAQDQIFHRAELVSGRCRTAKAGSIILSPSAAPAAAHEFENLLDAGGNRLGDYLEISVLHSAGRWFGGRVLLRGADE